MMSSRDSLRGGVGSKWVSVLPVLAIIVGGFAVLFQSENGMVRAPPTSGTLTITFHDLTPDTNTFPGDVNVSMISLEMTASGGPVQLFSIEFTLLGTIRPSEISSVGLWDDTSKDRRQERFECELDRNLVIGTTFTIPPVGLLSECLVPNDYSINDTETRHILVLLSVNSSAVPGRTIGLRVDMISTDGVLVGGTGATRTIEVLQTFFSDDMESGQGSWQKEGWDKGHMHEPEGLWHLSQNEEDCTNNNNDQAFFHSYNTGWWYGHRYEDPSSPGNYTCSYYTHMPGQYLQSTRNMGNLTTPEVNATAGESLFVTFWHRIKTEQQPAADEARLWLYDGTWHRITPNQYYTTEDSWWKMTINLSAYAGQNIRLEFRFDTIDRQNNIFLGWLVDDVTVYGKAPAMIPAPRNLTTTATGEDILLNWESPLSPLVDYYLVYRHNDQREFDFTSPVYDTFLDPNPLRTNWTDVGADGPGSPQEYYYVVRAANIDGRKSITSNTAGKWTRSFSEGRDAFSLPLEPFVNRNVSWYSENIPGAEFVRWMNATGHWVTHYPSMGEGVNDIPAIMGDSYEVSLSSPINFTFCGYPASMIRFREGLGDPLAFGKSLSAKVDGNDINLSWEAVAGADSYLVFRSEERRGLHNLSLLPMANSTETYWMDSGVIGGGRSEYYYMVIPSDSSGELGSSTYGVGVFTEEYQSGTDTFALPLKPVEPHSLDWYSDNIPNVVGMIHLMKGYWRLHAIEMPEGVYDVEALQGEGYQSSIDGATTTYTFVGY